MTTGLHLPGTDESGSYGIWAREQEKRLGQRTGRQVPWAELSDIRQMRTMTSLTRRLDS